MRCFAAIFPFLAIVLTAQTPVSLPEIHRALSGVWVGTLEYRDYSEPATSTKRVKLPTWLTVETDEAKLRFRYVYDDGPSKTVSEVEIIGIDPVAARYQVFGEDGKAKDSYAIVGLAALKEGRGTLTLTGPGIENGAPTDVRTTLRIGRNILEITRETAPRGQQLAFRHAYTMVRVTSPELR